MQNEKEFLLDISEIRRRARDCMEQGAVTQDYRCNPQNVIRILNEALATEIVCVLRYKRHYYTASGIHSEPVAQEFMEHAAEELRHADLISARITQLGGKPDWNPANLRMRSHSEYREGTSLANMLREDLVAERIAIQTYSEIVRFLGDRDITTRRILEEILSKEEEHAEDLSSILNQLEPAQTPSDSPNGREPNAGPQLREDGRKHPAPAASAEPSR